MAYFKIENLSEDRKLLARLILNYINILNYLKLALEIIAVVPF